MRIVNALLMKCELFCDCVHPGQCNETVVVSPKMKIAYFVRETWARDGLQLTCRYFFLF